MGAFFCNVVVAASRQDEVAALLEAAGRVACVSPDSNGMIVVFDEAANDLDLDEIDAVGALLTRGHERPALALIMADSDETALILYRNGRCFLEYSSVHKRENAAEIMAAWPTPQKPLRFRLLLQWPGFLFEDTRMEWICRMLSIRSDWANGNSYRYMRRGEIPDGLLDAGLLAVNGPLPKDMFTDPEFVDDDD